MRRSRRVVRWSHDPAAHWFLLLARTPDISNPVQLPQVRIFLVEMHELATQIAAPGSAQMMLFLMEREIAIAAQAQERGIRRY